MSRRSTPPVRTSKPFSCTAWSLIAVAVIGLLVHGFQAGKLGLYWDDSYLFLHSLQLVDGDIMRFILRDAVHFLPSERPLAYLPHIVSRASFALSLALAHWVSVVFLVLAAVVLAILAQKLVRETWFSFAVGVIFLTYPLAPLQAIWITGGIHYLWAAILTLIAILLFLHGLKASEKQRLRYFAVAALSHLAGMLTHEGFILMAPMFVSLYLIATRRRETTDSKTLGPIRIYWPAVHCLGLFLIAMVIYAIWREIVIPLYGDYAYSSSLIVLTPRNLALKFMTGLRTALVPLDDVLKQIMRFPPEGTHLLLSGILAASVWAIILRLRATQSSLQEAQEFPTLHAFACGMALTVGGIVILAILPSEIGGAAGRGVTSRMNFIMTIGVAIAWPAFLALIMSHYKHFALLAGWLSIALVLYKGFTSSLLLGSHELFSPSTFTIARGGYKLVILGYLLGSSLLILAVISASLLNLTSLNRLPLRDRLSALAPKILNHFVAGTVASLVLIGSLFHFSIKGEYIDTWNQYKSMLDQLQKLAPAVRDNTFFVFVENPRLVWGDPFATHYEHSSFLMTRYGNSTITGNSIFELRFHRDGAESTFGGNEVMWDYAGGVSAPIPRRIPYDRLLIFEFSGRSLRMLPKIEVKTQEGQALVVLNNPGLILNATGTNRATH